MPRLRARFDAMNRDPWARFGPSTYVIENDGIIDFSPHLFIDSGPYAAKKRRQRAPTADGEAS